MLVVGVAAEDHDVALLQQQPVGDGAHQFQQAAPAAGPPGESRVANEEDDHGGFHYRVWQSVHDCHPSVQADASRSASTIVLVRTTSTRAARLPEGACSSSSRSWPTS